jgi:hypothetical protein
MAREHVRLSMFDANHDAAAGFDPADRAGSASSVLRSTGTVRATPFSRWISHTSVPARSAAHGVEDFLLPNEPGTTANKHETSTNGCGRRPEWELTRFLA